MYLKLLDMGDEWTENSKYVLKTLDRLEGTVHQILNRQDEFDTKLAKLSVRLSWVTPLTSIIGGAIPASIIIILKFL